MKDKYKILVVDDHALFRAGLISLIDDMRGFEVVGEASNGVEALSIVELSEPDIILMDVNMPLMDGVEAVKELRKTYQGKILMLTISKQDRDLLGAIQSGADGYLLKNTDPDELQKALYLVLEDKSVLSPEVTKRVMQAAQHSIEASELGEESLTKRELEVLDCLANGLTTAQIATQLFISENTVKTHIRHILEKLNASNRAEAVKKATQIGIIR